MADTRTKKQRSMIMRSVRTKSTGPELEIRRLLFSKGYRYRLHPKHLPGKPDIVFPSRKKAIFVHGCFWHGHDCDKGRAPKSRLKYWLPKLRGNEERDMLKTRSLVELGWTVLTVWQCELKNSEQVLNKLESFLRTSATVTATSCGMGT